MRQSVRLRCTSRKRSWTTSVDVSRPHSGPRRRPSRISRRACRSRWFRNSRSWATDYDWRRCEATLKALPQFITEIDGLAIHFIHVRSRHEDALPLVVNHGWPGSIIEQLATGVGYAQEMANRPQTLYGIANSVSSTPVGVRTVMSASISRSS
jgi:hypothetical protein